MIGGGEPDDRPPTTSPPPSSPLQPTGGPGRRLLGCIRALLPAPTPAAAAPVHKVGLGLLLHLRPDHPCLRPTHSPSASASPSDGPLEEDAAAALPSPVTRYSLSNPNTMFSQWAAKPPPHLPKPPRAPADESGASEEQNLLVEESGASGTQGAPAKDVPTAGDDFLLHEVLQPRCTGDHLRPATAREDDQEQDAIHPGDATTCRDIAAAAEDDQEKNADEAVEDGEVVEQVSTAVVDEQDKVVQQCAAYGTGATENEGAKDDQEKVVSATANGFHRGTGKKERVVSATANGCDRGTGKKEKVKLPYPQRPGKLNCPSYISKGTCSYGFSCQFHHPPLKAKADDSWCPSEQRNHGVAEILELNRIGLPIREGARNCTFYMRNGACRYGKQCHFNHPEHVIDAQICAPTGWVDSALQSEKPSDHHTTVDDTSHLKKSSDDVTLDDTSYSKKSSDHATLDDTSYSKKSSDHATLDDTSYSKKSTDHATLDDTSSSTGVLPPNIFRMLLPPQKVLPSTEAKVMPVKKDSNWSCTSDDSDGCCSGDSSDGPLCKQEHVDYPERPGRPECPFYMRFGDCKFASACNYHHPKDKYPERPGEQECPFCMKTRFCKFGAQCRFNHPKDPNPTAQSLRNAKHSVATNEHRRPTRVTLEDHMPKQQQYPERPGQPDCRYYLQYGKCKFMSACIFHHPRDGVPAGWNPSSPAHSDMIGPEIRGMPDCPFYMKSGKCHFGSACEFRHPKDICSTTEGAFGHRTGSASENSTRPENAAQQREETVYPERPGEPECFHYMDHGYCRFQMKCKYHHPAVRLSRKQHDSTYR